MKQMISWSRNQSLNKPIDSTKKIPVIIDSLTASSYLIRQFRAGGFGQITLDDCSEEGVLHWIKNASPVQKIKGMNEVEGLMGKIIQPC